MWDFVAENIQTSGYAISLDAPSVAVPFSSVPIAFRALGVLPAGTYAVTIRPVARNVTPNVACPVLTVPLEVTQAYEYVPVPVAERGWVLVLASVLALFGAVRLSRRRSIHRC